MYIYIYIYIYFFFLIWLYFHSIKKKKEKDSNRHGCDREVVYASEWFFLFKAMVDDKKRLSLVTTIELEQSINDTNTDTRLRCMTRERKGTVVYCCVVQSARN